MTFIWVVIHSFHIHVHVFWLVLHKVTSQVDHTCATDNTECKLKDKQLRKNVHTPIKFLLDTVNSIFYASTQFLKSFQLPFPSKKKVTSSPSVNMRSSGCWRTFPYPREQRRNSALSTQTITPTETRNMLLKDRAPNQTETFSSQLNRSRFLNRSSSQSTGNSLIILLNTLF